MLDAQTSFTPVTVTPISEDAGFFKTLSVATSNPVESWPERLYHSKYTIQPFFGGRKLVHIADPDMVKDVLLTRSDKFPKSEIEQNVLRRAIGNGLLTANGAHWKVQRKASSPVFRHSNLMKLAPSMIKAGENAANRLIGYSGQCCDVMPEMSDAALEVIGGTLLSGEEDDLDYRRMMADVDLLMDQVGRIDVLDFFPVLRNLPKPWAIGGTRAVKRLRREAQNIVKARREDDTPRQDLLSMLMAAKDPDTGRGLSDIELRDNINTFIGAGYDTTSIALTWSLYLLANAPEWQDRLFGEINRVCGDDPLTPEHLEHLTEHNMVLKEAMRLYPPAPAMYRVANEDLTLGDVEMNKGDLIAIAIYPMHRNSLLWDAPHSFDPTRFSPEKAEEHHRFQFIPFSGGARICIGMKFSLMEATAILAQVIRHVQFEPHASTAPYPKSRITLRPDGGMPLTVHPR
jgi:cytochrome P450